MKKYFKVIFLSFLILVPLRELFALDVVSFFWHSRIAGKNSVFVDVGIAPLVFESFDDDDYEFSVLPLDIRVEYLPPFPLPFSIGFFLKTPNPNLNSFGLRLAYHFDLYDSYTDLYVLYSFDFGFLRNDILEDYNDTPVPVNYYDFRFGIRRFFFSWFGIAVETGFKFESVIISLSIKIN